MQLELTGKTVLISGGSRGIGLAIAQAFAREGANVAISARNAFGLAQAKSSIETPCSTHQADATDPAACVKTIAEIQKVFGGLDILITCAGSGASVPPGQETPEEWQRMISVNLFSATNMITAATPLLATSDGGNIVCISSICGRAALGAPTAYSAAKAALDATVQNLCVPLAAASIRINAVSPGNILAHGNVWDIKQRANPEAVQKMLETQVPQKRLGTPESIADAVLFLASGRAAFITGANLVVDGGQTRGAR
jgi:3-oxoacyl-[acyl-carrier protein] reductase